MKKIVFILLAVISLVACKKEPETISVPFEKLEHFFSTTEATSSFTRKIMDEATFDSMFGYGAVMGNQQAPLDFTKEFVIAVVNPATDEQTKLSPVSLEKKNDNLVFTYSEIIGEKMSSITKPTLLIRVDRQYDAPLQVIKVQN